MIVVRKSNWESKKAEDEDAEVEVSPPESEEDQAGVRTNLFTLLLELEQRESLVGLSMAIATSIFEKTINTPNMKAHFLRSLKNDRGGCFTIKGHNHEEGLYLWTALVLIGQSSSLPRKYRFGPKDIDFRVYQS